MSGGDGEPVIMDPKFSSFWKFPEEPFSEKLLREFPEVWKVGKIA